MKKLFILIFLLASANVLSNQESLVEKMKSMDFLVFDSFNKCADENQLKAHEKYFSEDVEFYHDNGGVTWNRETMINNTKKFACGKYTRVLNDETFKAYPIKDFGAITEGSHKFCNADTSICDGKAKFLMVWENSDDRWQVTRVFSYGHLPN